MHGSRKVIVFLELTKKKTIMKSEAIMIAFATKSFIQTRETKNACRSLYTEPDNSFYVSI